MIKTLPHLHSSDSIQQELFNEYQYDMLSLFLKIFVVLKFGQMYPQHRKGLRSTTFYSIIEAINEDDFLKSHHEKLN